MCVATLTALVSCSRRSSGGAAEDSAAPRAETPTPAASPKKPAGRSPRVAGAHAPSPTTIGRPHLTILTPSSGSLSSGQIITVEVAGDRLTATGNLAFFGPIRLGELASADGRTIRFAVPQTFPSRGEVPPMVMQPGTYAVYVVNSNGTSDTLRFTIRDQQP